MIWFVSDTHFGHTNIIRFTGRPFRDVYHMNQELTARWNSVVSENDLIIHLGDFGGPRCKDPRPYLEKLKGNIILIQGNHDRNRMLEYMPFYTKSMCMRIGNFNCLLNHRPYYPPEMRKNDQFHDHENVPNSERYDFIISGHIHQKRLWTGKSFNLSVELHDYIPITQERLLEHLNASIV